MPGGGLQLRAAGQDLLQPHLVTGRPRHKDRDRLLFTLLAATGMRIGEALAIDVDDLDLTHDDEHVTVLAKGGRRRTILLDDPILVSLLRRYLNARGYRHGPLGPGRRGVHLTSHHTYLCCQ